MKSRRASWAGWVVSLLLIAGSIGLWWQRQQIVDTVQYYQYTPTSDVEMVAKTAGLTDDAKFTFYATHPSIESSQSFNQHCQRKEADSPILGCYASNRIHIFNVTDERLKDLKAVTAAHELLHAEYDRLPQAEKKRIQPLLESAYKEGGDKELEERMAYYAKTEPGESINELHSIIGTEFASLSPELEAYYKQYFTDRQALATMHAQVDATFKQLSSEADRLVSQIELLAATINQDTKAYNSGVATLNARVEEFNARANRPGGFSTQSQFQGERQGILADSAALNGSKQTILRNIAAYKALVARLNAINAESAKLNQSLDSTLSDVPTI